MLTPKQYEAIGRITLGFNELEEVIEDYLASFIESQEAEVALCIAAEDLFNRKIDRLRKLIKALCIVYPAMSEQAEKVVQMFGKAKAFATKRNNYVHAYVTEDNQTKRPMLRFRKSQPVACDEEELNTLATEMRGFAADLSYQCFELLEVRDVAVGR